VGIYTILGYTWQPERSLWTRRAGVIKVQDGPDPAQAPPAVAVHGVEAAYNEHTLWLTGCLDGMPGTTLRAAWTLQPGGSETEATELYACTAENGEWAIPWAIPTDLGGEIPWVRIEATDDMGRTTRAYVSIDVKDVTVCGASFVAPPECETYPPPETEPPPAPAPVCLPLPDGGSGTSSTSASSSSGTSVTSGTEAPGAGTSCGCVTTPPGPRGGPWALLGALATLRRRRQGANSRTQTVVRRRLPRQPRSKRRPDPAYDGHPEVPNRLSVRHGSW
jgi:MYXO-CTERM domain-containing protein